jgi:hypothetical protein
VGGKKKGNASGTKGACLAASSRAQRQKVELSPQRRARGKDEKEKEEKTRVKKLYHYYVSFSYLHLHARAVRLVNGIKKESLFFIPQPLVSHCRHTIRDVDEVFQKLK